MNTNKLKYILYFIVLVIASTIAIQVYWNYKNYQINKQQLINDVQISLDNAVDTYYENLAKNHTMDFAVKEANEADFKSSNSRFKTLIGDLEINETNIQHIDSINSNSLDRIIITRGFDKHSIKDSITKFNLDHTKDSIEWNRFKDSTQIKNFVFLTSKVILSITNDSIKLRDIDSLLKIELNRKTLPISYGLSYKEANKSIQTYNAFPENDIDLSTTSKSSFLPQQSQLHVYFKNETKLILTRIFGGILLSTLLVLSVISCLLYLLKIINKQKQLAEVKNDLISNITHEFKTPIATIGVALESIKSFNVLDDKEKTKKYLNLSSNQLSKLNIMVEKLLETATLDSESLELNKETVDVVTLVSHITDKHQLQTIDKTLKFSASEKVINTFVDVFHFENAINNIVDNAVKYGGNNISISINKKIKSTEILILDSGNTLTKQELTQVFDKFYRVPKGNTHDVKGFGIGLYYTKKIIEKHNGKICVLINNGTTFKITIPNE